MKSALDKLSAVDRAQRAAQSGIVSFVEGREAAVVDRMVAAYRGGELKGEQAIAMIGVIAELRSARDEAKRAILAGTEAGATLAAG